MCEHWNLTVRGIGRTGFVNGGNCGNQSFPTRVDEVVADDPEMVIVEGGLNDAGQSGIGAAAREVLARIPATIRVVVVGPTDAPGRSGDGQTDHRPRARGHCRKPLYLSAGMAAAIRSGRNPHDCGKATAFSPITLSQRSRRFRPQAADRSTRVYAIADWLSVLTAGKDTIRMFLEDVGKTV
jgi:hypothetical protein